MSRIILVLLPILFFVGCSNEPQEAKQLPSTTGQEKQLASAHTTQPQASQPSLLFFLDPNGAPCQMQDTILRSMQEELQGKVRVQYIKTTVPAQKSSFYENGIRALPTLLLADSNGKEIQRLTPGVQEAVAIRALIKSSRP